MTKEWKWAVCVTTIPKRRESHLPQTLESLRNGGFTELRICVDGCNDPKSWEREFGHPVTCRHPNIYHFGAWVLSLAEIYIRSPDADFYLIAQDDLLCSKNLRQYLEAVPYQEKTYRNLYTFPSNLRLAPENGRKVGWYRSDQLGKGALGLMFDRETVLTLLTHQHTVERPMDPLRGWKAIDGGVVTALKKAGWTELVHNPSLLQHTGTTSTMNKRRRCRADEVHPLHQWAPNTFANSFRGEDFDLLTLLSE